MIVFLTLLYVGALAIAVKVGLVKLTLWWKMSPLVWMLLLFVMLFLPMQWGAPGGSVNVYQYVVEVIPNVSGEVIDVPVEPLEPLEPGDVLFQIDPIPFQAKVDQLEAQLEASIQDVEQLKAASDAADAFVVNLEEEIEVKKADVDAAAANVLVAKSSKEQAETSVQKATTLVADLKVQVAAGSRELERQKELLEKGAGALSDVDRTEVQYTSLLSQFNVGESDLLVAEQQLSGSRASLEAEQANQRRVDLQLKQTVDADLPRTKALAKEAKLAAESMIGDEHTSVADVRAQLVAAKYDLEQTVVRAPSEGHVVAATLRPGQRVASFPVRSWMAFVDHKQTEVVVAVQQYALRNVRRGQQAEVTFQLFPGRVFSGTVKRIAYSTSTGQLSPSGQIVTDTSNYEYAEPYAVVVDLDDTTLPIHQLPGGAAGSAAIYTQSMSATHIIRRIMIRMDAWMNYVIP
jgi:multidrug resistance efflux pump